jgi:hypothetical protein
VTDESFAEGAVPAGGLPPAPQHAPDDSWQRLQKLRRDARRKAIGAR